MLNKCLILLWLLLTVSAACIYMLLKKFNCDVFLLHSAIVLQNVPDLLEHWLVWMFLFLNYKIAVRLWIISTVNSTGLSIKEKFNFSMARLPCFLIMGVTKEKFDVFTDNPLDIPTLGLLTSFNLATLIFLICWDNFFSLKMTSFSSFSRNTSTWPYDMKYIISASSPCIMIFSSLQLNFAFKCLEIWVISLSLAFSKIQSLLKLYIWKVLITSYFKLGLSAS